MIFVLQIAAGVALGTLAAEGANLLAARVMLRWAMRRADRWLRDADAEGKPRVIVKKPSAPSRPGGFWH